MINKEQEAIELYNEIEHTLKNDNQKSCAMGVIRQIIDIQNYGWKNRAIELGFIISSELTKEFNRKIIAVARLRDLDSGSLIKECPLFIADTENEVIKRAFEFIVHKQLETKISTENILDV